VLVRLDTVVRMMYRDTLVFQAVGLHGFGRDQRETPSMLWSQSSPTDSLEVGTSGVGGVVWRLHQRGDSVTGLLYTFDDLSVGLAMAGPTAGIRVACAS
jgi:hypothetical protein